MVKRRILSPAPLFDRTLLLEAFEEAGVKPVHVATTWNYVLAGPGRNPWDAPGLPAAARSVLQSRFTSLTSTVVTSRTSADGSTTKLLVRLQDGLSVEAVVMRHDPTQGLYAGAQRGGSPRATLCVSSQAGCQMGCTFCATGTMGLSGNLAAGEIVEQLVHARAVADVRNVVFMGMGEPLMNYAPVVAAVQTMTSVSFGLSPQRITVSTVGVAPRIASLATDLPRVNLALSLHAPNQELRARIVPAARAHPLPRLMAALDAFLEASQQRVFIEYVMLAGHNDGEELAHELGRLLEGRRAVVNLIPYNPTAVVGEFTASDPGATVRFQKILRGEYALKATVRREMGQDIAGACGQLVVAGGITSSAAPLPLGEGALERGTGRGQRGQSCDTADGRYDVGLGGGQIVGGIIDIEELCR